MESVEKEFENFFAFCKNQNFSAVEMQRICGPLKWAQRFSTIKPWGKVLLVFVTIYWLYNTFDCVSWFLSALLRLLLIQLLPYWNWTSLYEAKCLIERPYVKTATKAVSTRYTTDAENCHLCETLERVTTAANVTFSFLETNYLESGNPVIIMDSHAPKALDIFLNSIYHGLPDFLSTDPCDLSTNIMFKHRFNMELALQRINNTLALPRWFLQLRNCQFKAVKLSRVFINRPYYYPVQLEPFYSSWLIFSHNYARRQTELLLQGLIIVQQWQGYSDIQLLAKTPCTSRCPDINVRLLAGESLVFSTDLWVFSYTISTKGNSVTTILEIDWQL